MGVATATVWGPPALVDLLIDQLVEHGFERPDPSHCAAQLGAARGPAARASLFADLGACHFLAGDVTAAIAAWRHASVSGQPAPAARALFNIALLHHELGLHDLAADQLAAVMDHRVEPHATEAVFARAVVDRARGDDERAMAALARLADGLMVRSPGASSIARALLGVGEIAEQRRELARAEHAYRAAAHDHGDAPVAAEAVLGLIRVLRMLGRDDEAHQLVDRVPIGDVDPAVALDRVELLVRLGRVDEAAVAVELIDGSALAVPDRFRLITTMLDVGLVNPAIDELEVLSTHSEAEPQARATYLLGEVYFAHRMYEPAAAMLERVHPIQPGHWADKAHLALGDMAAERDELREAAEWWASAAASSTETIAVAARRRLVDAAAMGSRLDAPQALSTDESIGGESSADSLITSGDDEPTEMRMPDAPPDSGTPTGAEAALAIGTPTEALEIVTLEELDDDEQVVPGRDLVEPASDVVIPGEPIVESDEHEDLAYEVELGASADAGDAEGGVAGHADGDDAGDADGDDAGDAEGGVAGAGDDGEGALTEAPRLAGHEELSSELDLSEVEGDTEVEFGVERVGDDVRGRADDHVDAESMTAASEHAPSPGLEAAAGTGLAQPDESDQSEQPDGGSPPASNEGAGVGGDASSPGPQMIPLRRRPISAQAPPPGQGVVDRAPTSGHQPGVDVDPSRREPRWRDTPRREGSEPSIVPLAARSSASEQSGPAGASGGSDAAEVDRSRDDFLNPYAALAPEALADDPRPSARNPYAELAPRYGVLDPDDRFDELADFVEFDLYAPPAPLETRSDVREHPDTDRSDEAPSERSGAEGAFSKFT